MAKKYSTQQIAQILVESDFAKDADVCEKWGIRSTKTLWNYKRQLSQDPDLLIEYERQKKAFADSWVEDTTSALKAGAIRLKQLFKHGSGSEDAEFIKAVVEGCKVLGDLHITFNALKVPDTLPDASPATKTVDVTSRPVDGRAANDR